MVFLIQNIDTLQSIVTYDFIKNGKYYQILGAGIDTDIMKPLVDSVK